MHRRTDRPTGKTRGNKNMTMLKSYKKNEETLNKIFDFIETFEEGIILFEKNTNELRYINYAAEQMLGFENKYLFQEIFEEEESEKLIANGYLTKYINGKTIRFSIETCDETNMWIRLTGEDELTRFEESMGKALELNKSMRKILMEYDQSSLMISDGEGTVIFAGQETVDNCGHDKNWYIGKTVDYLEKQRVFYPSVIKKVIETGEEQVVIQKTEKSDKLLVAIGVPIFNDNGELEQVLSITKDYTAQIDLSSIIAKMEFGMDITNEDNDVLEHIITCNDKMTEIKSLIRQIAPTSSTVLILGETGTGKELIAKAIHNLSDRRNQPFVVVSCGSLSPNIVESELFGYEAGSFTGASREGKRGLLEAADKGTVFLDEIGELPMEQQVKLLHVLQEKSIVRVGGTKQIPLDIRVVAATNRDLREEINRGRFREDLYYRLNVVSIVLPSLCERRGDIPLLVKHFTRKFNVEHGKNKVISRNVMETLNTYNWPGNIRELENLIENLIVTTQSNYIEMESLPDSITKNSYNGSNKVIVKEVAELAEIIGDAERQLLIMAREKYRTTSEIAKVLNVNQSTVSRKLKYYGIK